MYVKDKRLNDTPAKKNTTQPPSTASTVPNSNNNNNNSIKAAYSAERKKKRSEQREKRNIIYGQKAMWMCYTFFSFHFTLKHCFGVFVKPKQISFALEYWENRKRKQSMLNQFRWSAFESIALTCTNRHTHTHIHSETPI